MAHHIAARLPAEPGWRALVIQHGADGKPIEPVPGKTSVEFIDVAAWAILVNPSPWGAVWAAFLGGGGGQPAPAPLDAAGERLDTRKGYMMLSPPGESVDEACRRVEGGTAPKGEEVRS